MARAAPTFWLRYKMSCVSFLRFQVLGADRIHVKGPQGCASYIDREMTRQEAREFWAECLRDGYHKIGVKEAPGQRAFEALTYGR